MESYKKPRATNIWDSKEFPADRNDEYGVRFDTPEKRLWWYVIQTAIFDVTSSHRCLQRDAIAYLFGRKDFKVGSFYWILSQIAEDPILLRDKIRERIKENSLRYSGGAVRFRNYVRDPGEWSKINEEITKYNLDSPLLH